MTGPQRALCIALFALGLSSCAAEVRSIPDNYAMGARDESVVIGRAIIDLTGGGTQPIAFFDHLDAIQIEVENAATGESYWMVCDQTGSDSSFFVALPSGSYGITGVRKGQMEGSPTGHFSVGAGQVVYIGTLKFAGSGIGASIAASVLGNRPTMPGDWLVEDEYAIMAKSFQEKFPQLGHDVVKSLVQQ